ncbi:MAG TPA: Ig-like domain-containing protein, partial [Gemmataceae bacterium]|nr:Ig-like domain-containing protein [Gemmataceae bacterium]
MVKCLTLCWILASSAWAIQPTQLAVGVPLTQVGQPVDLVAALYPPTVMEGTIAFTSDTVPIAGCEALPVDTGRAVCRTSFSKPGSYAIAASYGGTTSWGKSSGSATLTVGKLEPWAYIAMDPKDPIYGNNLIVNALVLGANGIAPTGSFTFYDNGKQLVVRPLKTDARASLDMTLPVGDHRVQAVYGGDANYIVSRPAEITFHVSQGTPVVAVSATPAQLGQQVTITASVTALSPTGSVTFQGVPGCESVPLAGGSAQCSATFKELGEVVVTAVYSGDGNLQQGSAAVRIQVYKAVPTLVVSAAPEESVYGQSGQAGALALGAPGLSPPSGPVVFTVDNTPPVIASLDQKGHASLDLQLGAGRHTIQALYGGDANYASVPPKTVSVTVARGTPVVAISSTPAQLGQIVTLTASVTALNPGGAVAFDGVPGCAAVPLDQGQARCQAVFPQLGELQVTANYSGDANLLPAKATMKLAVAKAVSSLYLAATEQPVYGKTIRVSALASPAPGLPPPTGMVSFSDGAAFLGSALLDAEGRASLEPPLTAGTHTIQAVYNGDSNYLPPGAKSITVVVAKATPAVVVSSTPAQVGQTVVVSVTVSGPSPTGSVTFGGAPNCGTVLLEAGRARCQTVYRQLGDAPVTAIYSGDANHNGASASSTVAVRKAVPGLYLAVAPQSPVFGQTAKVSALVMGAAGLPAPAGSVLFSDGAQSSAAPPDTEGRASWSAAFPAGSRRVTATFAGDANYAEASAAVTFVVARAETTTALAAPAGGPFTATVAAVAPGSGTPTGSVRFLRDGVAIGTAVLGRGVATLVSSVSGAITAEYSGDANFLASASTATAPPPKAIVMLSSDRNPAAAGAPVTFTAVVTPNPGTVIPTGTIRFTADGTLLGSMILSAGRGTVTSALASGSHAVEAAYAGDSVYPAASGTLTQIVTGAPSGLGLSASVPSAVYGQPVTFT